MSKIIKIVYLDKKIDCLNYIKEFFLTSDLTFYNTNNSKPISKIELQTFVDLDLALFWDYLKNNSVDLIFLDVYMTFDGVDLAYSISQIYPEVKIVLLSESIDYNTFIRALCLSNIYGVFPKICNTKLFLSSTLQIIQHNIKSFNYYNK